MGNLASGQEIITPFLSLPLHPDPDPALTYINKVWLRLGQHGDSPEGPENGYHVPTCPLLCPKAGRATGSHQVQVEADELQP